MWDTLWATTLEQNDAAETRLATKLDECVHTLSRRPAKPPLIATCTQNGTRRVCDQGFTQVLAGLRPSAWREVSNQAVANAEIAVREEIEPRLDSNEAGLLNGFSATVSASYFVWSQIMQSGWHPIIFEWIRKAVPEEIRKAWHALSARQITNPGMRHGGVLLAALVSGDDTDRERKFRMIHH